MTLLLPEQMPQEQSTHLWCGMPRDNLLIWEQIISFKPLEEKHSILKAKYLYLNFLEVLHSTLAPQIETLSTAKKILVLYNERISTDLW